MARRDRTMRASVANANAPMARKDRTLRASVTNANAPMARKDRTMRASMTMRASDYPNRPLKVGKWRDFDTAYSPKHRFLVHLSKFLI